MSPAEESFRENVDTPFTRGETPFARGPPIRLGVLTPTMRQNIKVIPPNHQVCPNTVPSHVYAALAPLATYLPVKPCVPILATSTLLSFVVSDFCVATSYFSSSAYDRSATSR